MRTPPADRPMSTSGAELGRRTFRQEGPGRRASCRGLWGLSTGVVGRSLAHVAAEGVVLVLRLEHPAATRIGAHGGGHAVSLLRRYSLSDGVTSRACRVIPSMAAVRLYA